MSQVWDTLIGVQQTFEKAFSETGTEIEELGMDRFNQPGWINRVWSSDQYRRAHVDVVDARDTKGLWMMHCCIFPHLENDGPIFGFDVIAGKNKITGCFHDYSATQNPEHIMIRGFAEEVAKLEWRKQRELPDWAKAIFSDHMVAAGNVSKEDELEQIYAMAEHNVYAYLDEIAFFNDQGDAVAGKEAQNRYAYYQKQNPHTPRTMTSLGLNEDDVHLFIQECLFPDIE